MDEANVFAGVVDEANVFAGVDATSIPIVINLFILILVLKKKRGLPVSVFGGSLKWFACRPVVTSTRVVDSHNFCCLRGK